MTDDHHLLPPEKALYTVPEAALILRIDPCTIWRHARAGRLKLVKIGRRTAVTRTELEAMILRNEA